MLPDRNILKTAKTILKIQDKLHPLLFGEDGFMLEETRQELLKKANFYIAKVLRTIQDIQVSDIILVGSSASYFYTSASDFDLKIILNLSHNRAIGSNVKKFLKILNNTFYRNNVRLRLYNHFIDIKFDEDDNFVMGNYSVLHNRWNIKPRCDFDLTGIQPALLIQNFYKNSLVIPLFCGIFSSKRLFPAGRASKNRSKFYRLFSSRCSCPSRCRQRSG